MVDVGRSEVSFSFASRRSGAVDRSGEAFTSALFTSLRRSNTGRRLGKGASSGFNHSGGSSSQGRRGPSCFRTSGVVSCAEDRCVELDSDRLFDQSEVEEFQ